DFALAHCNLGLVLRDQGRFTEALASVKQGHALGSKRPNWPYPSDRLMREVQRLVELDNKLGQVLRGDTPTPRGAEAIELARLCQRYKQLPAAATRFYMEAFDAQPGLADDPRSPHRYNAACAAALAGCGQGKDTTSLDEKQRAQLRQQALAWLQAERMKWS